MNEKMNEKMNDLFLKVKDLYCFVNSTCDMFEDFANVIDTDSFAERLDMLYDFSAFLGYFLEDFIDFIEEV